jgi:uncharacterized MnhB-related membrane protein
LPSIPDVLWEAALGARGWFIAIFGIGCGLIAFGFATGSENMTKAYAYALLMPFWLAALMGTVAIWSYRTRQQASVFSGAGKTMLTGAAVWNCTIVSIASAMEQLLTRTGVLDRPPRALTEAVVGPLVVGTVMALFISLPRGR